MKQHGVQTKPLHYSNVSVYSFHMLSLKQQVIWSQNSPSESPQAIPAWVKTSPCYKVPRLWRRKDCSKGSLCLMFYTVWSGNRFCLFPSWVRTVEELTAKRLSIFLQVKDCVFISDHETTEVSRNQDRVLWISLFAFLRNSLQLFFHLVARRTTFVCFDHLSQRKWLESFSWTRCSPPRNRNGDLWANIMSTWTFAPIYLDLRIGTKLGAKSLEPVVCSTEYFSIGTTNIY